MPAAFDRCVKAGGKVRTQKMSGGKFRKICAINGQVFLGHVQKKKSKKK